MRILQKNLLVSGKIKNLSLDLLILLFIYSAPIMNCILYVFGIINTSGQLAVIYVIVAMGSICIACWCFKSKIPKRFIFALMVFMYIFFSFITTKWMWGYDVPRFNSELKLYLATIPSVLLISLIVSWVRKKDINLGLIFFIDLAITMVSALVVFSSDGTNSAGLMQDSSGFIYQNTSYYAAYAMGMSIFILQELTQKSAKKRKMLMIFLIIFQYIECFTAGGRGGVVLALILVVYAIINSFGIKGVVASIMPGIIAINLFQTIIPIVLANLGIDNTGITRTMGILSQGLVDTERNSLWLSAVEAFWKKPILGNGIGSVFYLFNSYSHNCITDILCETGLIGVISFIIILILFIFNIRKLYYVGSFYRFLFMVTLCGITLNLFSGYIWVNQYVILPIAVVIINGQYIFKKTRG